MENNIYANVPSGGSIDLRGNFTKASNVRIRNEVGGTVATEVSRSVTFDVVQQIMYVDFPTLLLPWIDHVQHSFATSTVKGPVPSSQTPSLVLRSDLSNRTTLAFVPLGNWDQKPVTIFIDVKQAL